MSEQPDPLDWLEVERRRPGGSRADFRQQLDDLDRLVVEAAEIVTRRIIPTTDAFLQADSHAADETHHATRAVTRRCVQLEEACYIVLARQSPVATDLRHVVAVLRSVGDIDRSANLLGHVAKSLDWVHPPAMPQTLRDTVRQFGAVTSEIFAAATEAWRTHDALAANELADRDDEADLLQKLLLTDVYTGEQSIEEAVSLALVARYFERIADHGVEMARQVAYFLTGERPDQTG